MAESIQKFFPLKLNTRKDSESLCLLFRSRGKDAQVLARLGCSPRASRRCSNVILHFMPVIDP